MSKPLLYFYLGLLNSLLGFLSDTVISLLELVMNLLRSLYGGAIPVTVDTVCMSITHTGVVIEGVTKNITHISPEEITTALMTIICSVPSEDQQGINSSKQILGMLRIHVL